MKVLIVEDDPGVRVLLQTLVAEEGHTVEVAVDGPAGLDAFRQLRPDLVLSDIMMPHMDGLELLESIRAEDSDVLVVMLTGCGSEEYAVRALRHGANNYLQKPIDDTDIISLVQKYAAVIQDRAVDVEIHEMFVERAFTLQLETSLEIIPRVADRLLRETCRRSRSRTSSVSVSGWSSCWRMPSSMATWASRTSRRDSRSRRQTAWRRCVASGCRIWRSPPGSSRFASRWTRQPASG